MITSITIADLLQRERIILRRLRTGPLTEFELTAELAQHAGFSASHATEQIGSWLEKLAEQGYIWTGKLHNRRGQWIRAAALTRQGKKLVA